MTMDTVVTFLVGGIISALLTSFIHTLTSRNNIKAIVQEIITTHEQINHKENPTNLLKMHEDNCRALRKIDKMEKALLFLVFQLGGNSKELGLTDL